MVGGLAMIVHGSDYLTSDTDLAVASDPSNSDSIVRALAPFHPRPFHVPDMKDFPWDARSIFGDVVSLVNDAGDIDLIRTIPGVDSFDGLRSRAVTRTVFGEDILVASIDDLVAMKRSANRPKDVAHIAELESLRKLES